MRLTARVVGWFFHASGLLLIVLVYSLVPTHQRHAKDMLAIAAFGLGFFAIGIPFSGIGGFLWKRWKKARARGLARSLTRTLGSPVDSNEDLTAIRWVGTRGGTNVALTWNLDSATTQVSIENKGGSAGTFRIIPTWSRGGRLIGGRPTPTGHAQFDLHFLSRSEPPGLIGDLFAGNRGELLARSLLYLPRGTSCRVMLTLSDLRIRMPWLIRDRRILERLFDAADNFGTALHEAMSEAGYAILAVGVGSNARCPVCISPLEQEIVLCIRCRTPHHQGCWDYTGECALFACGGRRWIRP
jgi:hypothetical protein